MNVKDDPLDSEQSKDRNDSTANHETKDEEEDKHLSSKNVDRTKQDESEKTLTNEKNVKVETSRSEQTSDQNDSETDHETEREEEESDVAIHRKVSEKHERMKQSQYCNRSGPEKYIRSHTDVEEQMDWEVNHQMENNSNESGRDEESNLGNETEINRDEEQEQSGSGSGQQNICRMEEQCENEQHEELYLSSYPLPIITFARLGDLPKSKSDIMNHILMDGKRNVFYNYNMKNGDETKLVQDGTIDIAWHHEKEASLPSSVVLNFHGDAIKYGRLFSWVCNNSNIVVIFVAKLEGLEPFLQNISNSATRCRFVVFPLEQPSRMRNVRVGEPNPNMRLVPAKKRNYDRICEDLSDILREEIGQLVSTRLRSLNEIDWINFSPSVISDRSDDPFSPQSQVQAYEYKNERKTMDQLLADQFLDSLWKEYNVNDPFAQEATQKLRRILEKQFDEAKKIAISHEGEAVDKDFLNQSFQIDLENSAFYLPNFKTDGTARGYYTEAYSKSIAILKEAVLKKMQGKGISFKGLNGRVDSIWEAILNENFVFNNLFNMEKRLLKRCQEEASNLGDDEDKKNKVFKKLFHKEKQTYMEEAQLTLDNYWEKTSVTNYLEEKLHLQFTSFKGQSTILNEYKDFDCHAPRPRPTFRYDVKNHFKAGVTSIKTMKGVVYWLSDAQKAKAIEKFVEQTESNNPSAIIEKVKPKMREIFENFCQGQSHLKTICKELTESLKKSANAELSELKQTLLRQILQSHPDLSTNVTKVKLIDKVLLSYIENNSNADLVFDFVMSFVKDPAHAIRGYIRKKIREQSKMLEDKLEIEKQAIERNIRRALKEAEIDVPSENMT
ncbi:hypothetical protein Ciccas_011809 [Cichlidogyrus casuarinus]|uniref:Up-regulator of cell proliferation-like domain-containing protein n=1 Tax=Cichlidogyrus casuarinus TaxID=1844966 RepID=A0ABD2PSD2_9PLAT